MARIDATIATLIGLIITAFSISDSGPGQYPSQLAATAAKGVALSLLAGILFEARNGLKNLVRPDLVGLAAFYYLTLYEFLFPQPFFDAAMPHTSVTYKALWAIMLGITGIVLGRHFAWRGKQPFERVMTRSTPANLLLLAFWASFFLGFLHMLIAVQLDIPKMLHEMTQERFKQSWGRGKFGDWKALINELALLLYFIPPLAALIYARFERFSALSIVTTSAGFAWTIFYAFTTGTRSLLSAYLVTFMIAFAFATPHSRRKQVIVVCAACAAAVALSTHTMLAMRSVGFQKWWAGEYTEINNRQTASVFVDDNLLAIAKIVAFFPDRHPYLGLEIPYIAAVRPIPRAIWKGKPTGLSVSLEEDVFKVSGLTISSTFVGEGYMSGGLLGILAYSLGIGALAGWWNRMASPRNSELGILIYASGFFAVVITMRSIMTLTTAILTPAAGIVLGTLLIKSARKVIARRSTHSRGTPGKPPYKP